MDTKQNGMTRVQRLEALRTRDGIFCFHPDCRKPFKHLTADVEISEATLDLFDDITFDHWFPKSLGGTWDISNLRMMHKRCNALKGDLVPNDDGTLPVVQRETQAERRAAKRGLRAEVCTDCNSGRLLDYGDTCATCGSGPQPAKFPQWAKMRPNECDHDLFHCWACILGIYERKPAILDVLNAGEVDP